MAKKTSEEAHSTHNDTNTTVGKMKKELGSTGFVGMVVGLVIIVIATAVFFFNYTKSNKNTEAQAEMFQAQFYFEQDSLDLALNGDGRNLGFLSIIDIYGGTDASNLSNFYAGVIYLKEQQFQLALDHLQKFSTSEELIQARAYELTGDAFMELGNFSNAAKEYQKAATTADGDAFSPVYLLKSSLAYEKQGDLKAAVKPLDEIIKNYFGTAEYASARKHKARLEGLAGS
ncbi:tetratricopeptide repeat protein [Roseivirga echinicomitans]